MHTQDVYASEKTEIGSFTEIGYDVPTSNVFDYSETNTPKTQEIFKANPKSPLDGVDGDWTVTSTINSSTGKTTHTAALPSGKEANAVKLTPNFTNIGGGAASGSGS